MNEICRLCLKKNFIQMSSSINDPSFRHLIDSVFYFSLLPFDLPSDISFDLPQFVCSKCTETITDFYNYSKLVQANQEQILQKCNAGVSHKVLPIRKHNCVENREKTVFLNQQCIGSEFNNLVKIPLQKPVKGTDYESQSLQSNSTIVDIEREYLTEDVTISEDFINSEYLKEIENRKSPTGHSFAIQEKSTNDFLDGQVNEDTIEDTYRSVDHSDDHLIDDTIIKESNIFDLVQSNVSYMYENDDDWFDSAKTAYVKADSSQSTQFNYIEKNQNCNILIEESTEKRNEHIQNMFVKENAMYDKPTIMPKTETYDCKICNKFFATKNELRVHKEEHITTQLKEFPTEKCCPICHKTFTPYSWIRHTIHAHDIIVDTGGTIQHLSEMKKCSLCNEKVNSGDLKRHIVEVHQIRNRRKVLRCTICDVSFSHVYDLNRHNESAHDIKPNRPYACDQCNQPFESLSKLKVHLSSHEHKECPVCNKTVGTRYFKCHMMGHAGVIRCKYCTKTYTTLTTLKNHLALKHSSAVLEKHNCQLCEQSFFSRSKLNEHTLTHSKTQCHLCGKHMSHKTFAVHRTLCGVPAELLPKFKCNHCDRVFPHIKKLKNHLQGLKKRPCIICKRMVATNAMGNHRKVCSKK